MVAIRAIQEEVVVPLAMVPIIKVVTTTRLLLLSMLGKNNNMVDSRNLLMAQGISPIKANSNNHITKINMAIMVRHKASRRAITKATMLLTQIPTTLLVAVVEDQTTIMKVNSIMVVDVEEVVQTAMFQEVPPTMPVAMGEELGEEDHLTKVDILSQITILQLQIRITVDLPIPTNLHKLDMAEMTTA